MAIPVNTPQPRSASPDTPDDRLYLRDQELDQAAALIRSAARRLSQLVQRGAGQAARPLPELEILQEIFDRGPLDVGDLREILTAPKQSLARHLNDLEASGLVKRTPDARDRRKRIVTLTEEGRDLVSATTELRRRALRQSFLAAGPEAVSGARRVLQTLAKTRGAP